MLVQCICLSLVLLEGPLINEVFVLPRIILVRTQGQASNYMHVWAEEQIEDGPTYGLMDGAC